MPGLLPNSIDGLLKFYSRIAPTERGGYRLARFARRFHPRNAWRSTFTIPNGTRLHLDLATYPDCCMAYGLYELDTARLITRLLQPGDHFVDGGANIGYFTLLAAQRVGSNGRVDAFEPQPENRARLESHLRVNGLTDRVRVHDVALSDRAGQAVIHSPKGESENHGVSSLFTSKGAATVDSSVATARMDELLANTNPRLIKLDIEGAEPLAITGMAGLLNVEKLPAIIMEHNVVTLGMAGFGPGEAVERLLAIQPRYRVRVIGWRLRRIEPTAAILAALGQVNLLFEA